MINHNRHPERSEAKSRDLFFCCGFKNRSLHCASLRSAAVGMTVA
jgi:hypothetical protein